MLPRVETSSGLKAGAGAPEHEVWTANPTPTVVHGPNGPSAVLRVPLREVFELPDA